MWDIYGDNILFTDGKYYRKCSKIWNIFLFLFFNYNVNYLNIRAETHKMFARIASLKQYDLGLHCLSRLFASVQNF